MGVLRGVMSVNTKAARWVLLGGAEASFLAEEEELLEEEGDFPAVAKAATLLPGSSDSCKVERHLFDTERSFGFCHAAQHEPILGIVHARMSSKKSEYNSNTYYRKTFARMFLSISTTTKLTPYFA